jgi:hypothetical protein
LLRLPLVMLLPVVLVRNLMQVPQPAHTRRHVSNLLWVNNVLRGGVGGSTARLTNNVSSTEGCGVPLGR